MRIAAALLIPALLASASAQAQAKPCITAAEGEGLALYMMPELIRAASTSCKPHLPARAVLAQPAGLIAKFQVENDAAWPAARTAFAKIAGDEVAPFLEGEMAKPMLSAMMGPMLSAEIKPKDCPTINHMVELLQPLPPRNTAALFVALAQFGMSQDKDANPKLPLCPFVVPR